jgi:electron transfer flavoprotein alpha/beta subunit
VKPTWVVCIKQVPTEPLFKRTGDAFQIDRDRTEGILNPYDRSTIDLALDLRDKAGGTIVALTMGPPLAEEALREAMACGADRAILLSDPAFAGADTLATAYTLASAIRKLGDFSLILCGARTLDSDTAQVGPQIAEFLDLPMAAYVDKASFKGGALRVERRLDSIRERLLLPLPALITVAGRLQTERRLSLGSVEGAFGKPVVVRWGKGDLDVDPGRIGWKGSATVATEYATLEHSRSGVRAKPAEAAERIIEVLAKRNVLGG